MCILSRSPQKLRSHLETRCAYAKSAFFPFGGRRRMRTAERPGCCPGQQRRRDGAWPEGCAECHEHLLQLPCWLPTGAGSGCPSTAIQYGNDNGKRLLPLAPARRPQVQQREATEKARLAPFALLPCVCECVSVVPCPGSDDCTYRRLSGTAWEAELQVPMNIPASKADEHPGIICR